MVLTIWRGSNWENPEQWALKMLLIVSGRTKTIEPVFPFRAKIIPEGDLVEASVVQADITVLIRIVIRYQEAVDVHAYNRRKKLQSLFSESAIDLKLGPIKTSPVRQPAPYGAKTYILVYLGIEIYGLFPGKFRKLQ
jgi:hypothetical protein